MSKRYTQVDVLYAIGIVLVIFGHSHSSDWNTFSNTILESSIRFVYTFHMPLFFFIAGFLFLNSNSLEMKGYSKWMCDKALRLMTPYVVLSVIAAVPKYWFENRTFSGMALYLFQAVFVPRMGVWGHFWFIPVLMLVYIAFGFLKQKVAENKLKLTLLITLLVSIVLYFLPFSTYWFGFSDFKEAVFPFTVGMIVNNIVKNQENFILPIYIRILWIVVAFTASIVLVKHFYGNKVIMVLVAVLMIFTCWELAELVGQKKVTEWISKYNFTIYLYSWPFQSVAMVLFDKLDLKWYIMSPCMFAVGLGMPICMILVYEYLKQIHNRCFNLLLGIK